MRDDRDIQRPKPASAPEKGRGPHCGKDRRCHSMSLPTCTDVSPPGTEIPRKCSRCPILLSTWHGIPAKACQVSLPAFYLARYSRESVPGVPSRCPPATVFPQKRSRCPILPSTWHGIPAKAFQVAPLLAVHLPRFFRKSVSGISSRFPPGTESPRKCSRWHLPASHLARNSCESVPGVLFCLPPATVVHLIMGCWCFSVGHTCIFLKIMMFQRRFNCGCHMFGHTCSSKTALPVPAGHICYCGCAERCYTWK